MTNDLIDDLLNAACHEHARQALQDVLVVLSRAGFGVDCALGDAAFTSEIKDGELRVTPPLTLASTDARRVHRIVELCVKRVQESAGAAQVERTLDELGRSSRRQAANDHEGQRSTEHDTPSERECPLEEWAAVAFNATIVSDGSTILAAGGRTMDLAGYDASELVGRRIVDFVAPPSRALLQQVVAEQRIGAYELVLISKSGDPIPVEVVSAQSTWRGRPVRFAGLRDLRQLRRLEADRWRLEQNVERGRRLQSWGTLAAGISHDFGNLLVGITANAEILTQLCTQAEAAEYAKEIHTAGRRAAELVAELLTYNGSRDCVQKELLDVGDLVIELRKLLSAKLASNATVVMRIEPGCTVLGNRARLSQVFMNLLTNASDALEGNPGQIVVTIDTLDSLDARWDQAWGARLFPGTHVLIEVRDTGIGMDATVMERAFEPFFTTKNTGNGLGLAACLDAIRAHDGAVHVESEQGKGTRFSVVIPARNETASAERRQSGRVPRSRHVFIVDNDTLFRGQLRHALELRGYRISEASSIKEAHTLLDNVLPDLLLIDMALADGDAVRFLTDLRKQGFSMPAVGLLGEADSHLLEVLPHDIFHASLRKPCKVSDLVSTLEQVTVAADQQVPLARVAQTR